MGKIFFLFFCCCFLTAVVNGYSIDSAIIKTVEHFLINLKSTITVDLIIECWSNGKFLSFNGNVVKFLISGDKMKLMRMLNRRNIFTSFHFNFLDSDSIILDIQCNSSIELLKNVKKK